jgi:threonine dehydrogenase-like Zn-dependent dehydrogenase
MRALVYHGPGRKAWEEAPDPDPTLMRLITTGQIDAKRFITHHFDLDEFDAAYDVFARAADTSALKVVLSRPEE